MKLVSKVIDLSHELPHPGAPTTTDIEHVLNPFLAQGFDVKETFVLGSKVYLVLTKEVSL